MTTVTIPPHVSTTAPEGVSLTDVPPHLADQHLLIAVADVPHTSITRGALLYEDDEHVFRRILDRRSQFTGDWSEYFLPVHHDHIMSVVSDHRSNQEKYGHVYSTDAGYCITVRAGFAGNGQRAANRDLPGTVCRVRQSSGYMRYPGEDLDYSWSSSYQVRVTVDRLEAFEQALLAVVEAFWNSRVDPGELVDQGNALLSGTVVEYVEDPAGAQVTDEVVDGMRVWTRRTPVVPRLRQRLYAERSFVEDIARDFAARNGQRDSLRRMLAGNPVRQSDGTDFNWKRDIEVVEHGGYQWVAIESVYQAAAAGKVGNAWCGVADQVAEAIRVGRQMRTYRVTVIWRDDPALNDGLDYMRRRFEVQAYSESNAERQAKDLMCEFMLTVGVNEERARLASLTSIYETRTLNR